jgi:hypothetical protein
MFYTITKYKKNGIEDIFISNSKEGTSKEKHYEGVVAYVDKIAPLESRVESELDTLTITFISEKDAETFMRTSKLKQGTWANFDGSITSTINYDYTQKMEKFNV